MKTIPFNEDQFPQDSEFELVRELRDALAAAMRVIAESDEKMGTYLTINFLAEAHHSGVKEGVGKRADKWLRERERENNK